MTPRPSSKFGGADNANTEKTTARSRQRPDQDRVMVTLQTARLTSSILPPRPRRPPEPKWENIPVKLTTLPRWVCWLYVFVTGRWTKVPVQPDGKKASVRDPASWAPFEFAECAYFSNAFDGVGFVLVGDHITVFDFDKCRNPATGEIDPKILSYVTRLNSYVEISPSQTGLRLIVEAKLPTKHYCRVGNVEVYDNARFVSVTGHTL